jgi:PilZ domain
MSRRKEKRNFLALPVRAARSDLANNGFRHVVCTLDLSAHGARVIGLPDIQVGQEVTLEHRKNKVRFQAVWVGQPGTAREGQVGLRSLDPQKKLADIEFTNSEYVDNWSPKDAQLPGIQPDRRSVQRFDCDRGVQYWTDESSSPASGQLDNISLNGCRIITKFPLARRTRISMVVSLYGMRISLKGEVREQWADGMGVMFTTLERDGETRLRKAVQHLSQATSSVHRHSGDQSETREAERILDDVRAFFDRNLTMSWEDFFDIQIRLKGKLVKATLDKEF